MAYFDNLQLVFGGGAVEDGDVADDAFQIMDGHVFNLLTRQAAVARFVQMKSSA